MARSVFINASTPTPKVNQRVPCQVVVQSTDANPVTVTDVQVYTGSLSSSSRIDKPQLPTGGGAGGVAATGVVRPNVINTNGQFAYEFDFTGFQPQVPGSTGAKALGYAIIAIVTWSDGTTTQSSNFPAAVTVSGQNTGGSLAAATYFVKVTALTPGGSLSGESLPSAEVNTGALTGVNVNQFTVTWTGQPGIVYRVYFGTATGAEANYFVSAAGASSLNVTTTAGQTAGSPPASDTYQNVVVSSLV